MPNWFVDFLKNDQRGVWCTFLYLSVLANLNSITFPLIFLLFVLVLYRNDFSHGNLNSFLKHTFISTNDMISFLWSEFRLNLLVFLFQLLLFLSPTPSHVLILLAFTGIIQEHHQSLSLQFSSCISLEFFSINCFFLPTR